MMTEQKIATGNNNDSISFAALPDDIVVIRIAGRGSFQNSMELRKLSDAMSAQHDGATIQFIIDLEDCITMDSTFMGVLASMGLRQLKSTGVKMNVVNTNAQNSRLLSTLGLSQFMTVRSTPNGTPQVSDDNFQCMIKEDASRTDRIIHMIEAHRDLCDADPANNLRFESVLKYLSDSLDREQ